MKKSLHRKDISSADFTLLARFISALNKVTMLDGGSVVWILGTITLYLPIWYACGDGWKIAKFKGFEREVVGIDRHGMKLVCSYLKVEEATILNLLMKFSMLGVLPFSSPDQIYRRMHFCGTRRGNISAGISEQADGFIIERRRVEGAFR